MEPDPRDPGRAAARRRPRRRPAPPRRGRSRPAPAPRQAAQPFGRFMRTVGILLLIAILAAIIAGAVLLLTDAGQNTNIGESIKNNIHDQIQALKDLITGQLAVNEGASTAARLRSAPLRDRAPRGGSAEHGSAVAVEGAARAIASRAPRDQAVRGSARLWAVSSRAAVGGSARTR